MKKLILLLLFGIFITSLASADIWISPKEPIINGNNYVFITYNDSTLADTPVLMNITDSLGTLKQECDITLNSVGFGRCKYTFASPDSSGTWGYAINTSVSGTFQVGKVTMNLKDRNSLTSIKYGQKTTLEVNFSYENLMPKEITRTVFSRDLGTHSVQNEVADFDGDGDNDILIIDYGGIPYIWDNITRLKEGIKRISGTDWVGQDPGNYYYNMGCAYADFNGNGALTLICGDNLGILRAYRDISLSTAISDAYDFSSGDEGTRFISKPTLCDVNNDGLYDQLAISVSDGDMLVYNYTDTAGFTKILDTGDVGTGGAMDSHLCADFDNDGYNEWILVQTENVTYYDVNLSNTNQLIFGSTATDRGTYYGPANAYDFDNDGKIEAILPLSTGRLQVLEYNKSETGILEEDLSVNWDIDYTNFYYGSASVNLEDLNKDGIPDFAIEGYDNHPPTILYQYNSTSGLFDQTIIYNGLIEASVSRATYVDFDGDGINEIMLFGRYSGNVYIIKFNGETWDLIYKGWQVGDEASFSGDGLLYAAAQVNGFLYGANCIVDDYDLDSREEVICLPHDGNILYYEQSELVENNVTAQIYLDVNMNEGSYEEPDNKYTDIRILGTGETLCIKQNIALGITDLVDEDNLNDHAVYPIWTDGVLSTATYRTSQVATDYSTLDALSTEEVVYSRIKLGANYSVGKVVFHNYFVDGRSFKNVIVRSTKDSTGNLCDFTENTAWFDNSNDGFNDRYSESSFGKVVFRSPIDLSCLRVSTAGSDYWTTTANTGNLRTEIAIYETENNCSFDVSLNRQAESSLSVKQNWTVNITATDRTGRWINITQSLSIPVTYSSLPFSVSIVGGTEYYPGQQGQIVIQLKDEFNKPVSGASCSVDYYYPNLSPWLEDQPTSEISGVGVYYDSFTLPNTDGVYIAVANCSSGTFSDLDSHTFHVSGILLEINNTVAAINSTMINRVIPYLHQINATIAEINSTTHASYNYLTGTIQPQLSGMAENISYLRNNMATASALSIMQTDITWLLSNVATQTNITETFLRLTSINSTINAVGSDLISINSSLQVKLDNIQGNATWIRNNVATQTNTSLILTRLVEINNTTTEINSEISGEITTRLTELNTTAQNIRTDSQVLVTKWGTYTAEQIFNISNSTYNLASSINNNMATASALSIMQTDITWLLSNVATQTNITETFLRLTSINSTINAVGSDLISINSSLQVKLDNIQGNATWIRNNVATQTNTSLILTRLVEINTTAQQVYTYLQETIYTKINDTFNNTQNILSVIGISSDTESSNTLFGEHAYTQNRISEIWGNLSLLNSLTTQINTTVAFLNLTASTILTEVDNLEEMHQCSLTPNSTICSLLNLIKNDTTNIYNTILIINTTTSSLSTGSGSLFQITSLVAGSPRYANENALIEATFAGQNGSAVSPDTINLTVYDPNNNIWTSAAKSDFTQLSDNVWKYTKSISSSPTTGMYTAHLEGTYLGISNSRVVQFRIATGGPYKVYLDCPSTNNVGAELVCSVILEDEGESATESTSTVWVDTDNDGIADAGEPQASFSKQTVAFQNVTQSISINIPSTHPSGLYVLRVDTSYANSAQPNSGASDSVTLISSTSAPQTETPSSGSGSVTGITGKSIYEIKNEEIIHGITKQLKDGDKAKFRIIQEKYSMEHSLEINDLKSDRVTITIYSEPIIFTLLIGQGKKVDINQDNYSDLYINLEKIENNKAFINLKSIYEKIIEEEKQIIPVEEEEFEKEQLQSSLNLFPIYIIGISIIFLLMISILTNIFLRKRVNYSPHHQKTGKHKSFFRKLIIPLIILSLLFGIAYGGYQSFMFFKGKISFTGAVISEKESSEEDTQTASSPIFQDKLFRGIALTTFIILALILLFKTLHIRGEVKFGIDDNLRKNYEDKKYTKMQQKINQMVLKKEINDLKINKDKDTNQNPIKMPAHEFFRLFEQAKKIN